jgi:hypothetical protein
MLVSFYSGVFCFTLAALFLVLLSFYLGVFASPSIAAASRHKAHIPSFVLFLSIYSLHLTLKKYDSCFIMSSLPKYVPTSSPSQPSKLGDSRVLNTSVGFNRDDLPAKIIQQNEEIRAHNVAL